MTTGIVVIDCSHHQQGWPAPPADTPWEAMAKVGIIGCVLKATEGVSFVDDTFRERYVACREHGVAVCSYHFLRPGSLPQQMDHYLAVVQPVQGERMVLDWEDEGVHVGDVEYCVNYLLDKRPDLQLTIYASSGFMQDKVVGAHETLAKNTSLWVARYSNEQPYWPEQVWALWSLWQCTDNFELQSYRPLDGNKFNGSVENCMVWLNPAAQGPAPTPDPQPEQMLVDYAVRVTDQAIAFDIATKEGAPITIQVNGQAWRPT